MLAQLVPHTYTKAEGCFSNRPVRLVGRLAPYKTNPAVLLFRPGPA